MPLTDAEKDELQTMLRRAIGSSLVLETRLRQADLVSDAEAERVRIERLQELAERLGRSPRRVALPTG